MNRIKPPHSPVGKIQNRTILPDAFLKFSFKFLDLNHDKFCTARCQDGYLDKLLQRLKDVSGLPVREFRANRSKALRCHPIEWSDTTERDGFTSLNEQLRGEEPWQFELTANEHGRVHGLLIDETFYVVWIDPAHKLYE